MSYAAHKLFLSASTTIQATWVPATELATLLRRPEKGRAVAAPADGAVAVSLASELPFGRDERVTLWLDPASGAALGGEKTSLGGSAYHKFMRFTEGGLFTWRRSPKNEREAARGPEDWTDRSRYLVEPALKPPQGAPVTDPYALLYLVSAARLDRKDSVLRLVLLSGDRYVEIALAAGGLSYQRQSFQESWPGGTSRRGGNILVRTVRGTARAVGAAETTNDVDLGFLGMRGTLTLFVEVGTGIPVAFSGRADYIGNLTVRLTRAVLVAPPESAAGPEPSPDPPPLPDRAPGTGDAVAPPEQHPERDAPCTRPIRQATSAPQVSTVLVDHLPASATVPTPLAYRVNCADNDALRPGLAPKRNVLKAFFGRLGPGRPAAR